MFDVGFRILDIDTEKHLVCPCEIHLEETVNLIVHKCADGPKVGLPTTITFRMFLNRASPRIDTWPTFLRGVCNATCNDISVKHVTAHRCAGGLKKLYLRSGSQRHRHFVGSFNVLVQAPARGHPFYGYSEKPPHAVAFYKTHGIRRTYSHLKVILKIGPLYPRARRKMRLKMGRSLGLTVKSVSMLGWAH